MINRKISVKSKVFKKNNMTKTGKSKKRTTKKRVSKKGKKSRKRRSLRGGNKLYDNVKKIIESGKTDQLVNILLNIEKQEDGRPHNKEEKRRRLSTIKKIFEIKDENGDTLLHLIAKQSTHPEVSFEEDEGIDLIENRDKYGIMLENLIKLIAYDIIVDGDDDKEEQMVHKMWYNNKFINVKNNKGNTALHSAIEGRNPFTYDVLIESLADPKIVNNENKTPIEYSMKYNLPNGFYNSLNELDDLTPEDIVFLLRNRKIN